MLRVWSAKLKTHGLVSVVNNKFFCYCCQKNFCDHALRIKNFDCGNSDAYLSIVQELLDVYNTENEASSGISKEKIICHSYKKIPFGPTDALINVFSSGIVQNFEEHNEHFVFVPKNTVCHHCSGTLDTRDPLENGWIASDNVVIVTNTYLGKGTGNIILKLLNFNSYSLQ